MAVKVRTLLSLRAEFDELAPDRDRGADGIAGDPAHQARSTDHNADDTKGSKTPHTDSDTIAEYHAVDVDSTGPWPDGMTMAGAVAVVVATCKSLGSGSPLAYVIWDHHIYEYPSWSKQTYSGSDPHTNHAHFSSRYGSGSGSSNPENYDGPWGLIKEFKMPSADEIAAALLKAKIGDLAYPNRTVGDVLRDVAKVRGVLVGDKADTANAALKPTAPLAELLASVAPPAA